MSSTILNPLVNIEFSFNSSNRFFEDNKLIILGKLRKLIQDNAMEYRLAISPIWGMLGIDVIRSKIDIY